MELGRNYHARGDKNTQPAVHDQPPLSGNLLYGVCGRSAPVRSASTWCGDNVKLPTSVCSYEGSFDG